MDKIALISDIHGNIAALEAVMDDIHRRGVTQIYCLGDLVGKGPYPEQVVDHIRERCEVVIQGNWDDKMTLSPENDNWVWQIAHQPRLGAVRLAYLRELPFSHDFYMSGRYIRLVHASPKGIYHRVRSGASHEERLEMFENTPKTGFLGGDQKPDVVGYGDIHKPYLITTEMGMLFNVGSVGLPLDGIKEPAYVILEGDMDSKVASIFSIQTIRVPYDYELAIRQAKETNMPQLDKFIREVTTGRS